MKYFLMWIVLMLHLGCKSDQEKPRDEAQSDSQPTVKERLYRMEQEALEEQYKGIFSSDGRQEDLFPIRATNVSTAPIVNAADIFLSLFSSTQQQNISFSITDQEWRKWSNVDNGVYDRQGISLKEMNAEQKEAAFKLMQASLSVKGLQLAKDIMKTDHTLKELHDGDVTLDEELYYFTMMGSPSDTKPWGWQLDGHHLVINYFILGNQVVMSPVFMGAEPVITTTGKYTGNTLFQDEQNLGLSFMRSLSTHHRQEATLDSLKTENNLVGGASQDNLTLDYQGLQAFLLPTEQQEKLRGLIYQYISNLREGHREIRMEEIIAHWDNTWFAWVGPLDEDSVFYYRIHSPVVLIEFDHQVPVGVPGSDFSKPSRNHIHTMLRTPNGNDYGKDLLRQHLETHHSRVADPEKLEE